MGLIRMCKCAPDTPSAEQFTLAIESDDDEFVRVAMRRGYVPNAQQLCIAIRNGSMKVFSALMEAGCEMTAECITEAEQYYKREVSNTILSSGCPFETRAYEDSHLLEIDVPPMCTVERSSTALVKHGLTEPTLEETHEENNAEESQNEEDEELRSRVEEIRASTMTGVLRAAGCPEP